MYHSTNLGMLYGRKKSNFVKIMGASKTGRKNLGLDQLSLTERDVFQSIFIFLVKINKLAFENILNN